MISDHASKLLQAACDASFACGEWVKDDDEPYGRVYADSATAYEAIAGYIVGLESALRLALNTLGALGGPTAQERDTAVIAGRRALASFGVALEVKP